MDSIANQPFNKELNRTIPEIIDKYVAIICEYFAFIGEKKNIIHKKQYPYLRTRGLDTITHVFVMILFYTKNLELTYYHSQKSFYFYVEFIEQILDVQHTFLHLSSRDASVFVYKKTIYEIIPENRKDLGETNNIQFAKINLLINIYKQIPCAYIKDIHCQLQKNPNISIYSLEKIYDFVYTCDDNNPSYVIDATTFILNN
jgi:hypothetical protein